MAPVPQVDFSLYPRLAEALERNAETGRPLYQLVTPACGVVADLATVGDDAAFVALNDTSRNPAHLKRLLHLEALWIYGVKPIHIEALTSLPRLRAVYLRKLGKPRLEGLGSARTLEHLMLDWGQQPIDLGFLKGMRSLRTLYLNDIANLDLATLPALNRLVALDLGGGMWRTLKVATFAPLAGLTSLRHLALPNTRPIDGDLKPLASLQQLESLLLPNAFSVEQLAELATRLPRTSGSALRPIFFPPGNDSHGRPIFPCPKCGASRAMMTGRPASLLCLACDAGRVRKRIARWEAAYASASSPESRHLST